MAQAEAEHASRCGQWDSPLTAAGVAAAAGGPSWPAVVGPETWWCASRTDQATVKLLRCGVGDDRARDVLGGSWKVSNGAIGYGGRPYLAVPGRAAGEEHLVVFTESSDHRLYAAHVAPLADADDDSIAPETTPFPLTPADPADRETCYADPILSADRTEVWCVRETAQVFADGVEHDPAETTARDVIAVPLDGSAAEDPGAIRVVAGSHHFLSGIRVSPDGGRLCWIGWNHPDMPWDTSDLMVAELADGVAGKPVRVLGGPGVSVSQAEWADADSLYAMADPDGWWNLHRVGLGSDLDDTPEVTNLLPMESECAHAIWRVGATSFAVTDDGVVFRHGVGDQQLVVWDPATGDLADLAPGWTEFAVGVSGSADAFATIGYSPTERGTPLRIDLTTGSTHRCPGMDGVAEDEFEAWYSKPERHAVTNQDGRTVYFSYYPPTNPDHAVAPGELPPLLIDVHGGPTSTTGASRALTFSFFTSRGFAVASVDYGGSTSYGRAYRDLLNGTWGVVDVEDSVYVAQVLAESGLADPARVAIRGGSAGGWTTLVALTHSDAFCCGVVYYPIADPFTWYGAQTHDFESRYIFTLLGGEPDRAEAFYRRVSPMLAVANLSSPFIMLQGADDGICRPDQADRFVTAARARHGEGICRSYLRFPGEGHGFRLASSISASLAAELALFTEVMVSP